MSEIKGYESLMAKLNKLTGSQIDEVANNSVKNVVLAQSRVAKQLVPVGVNGGGELKSSIHTKNEKDADGVTGYCYSDSDHAAYVEFGTGPIGAGSGGNGSDVKVSYTEGPFRHVSRNGKVYYTNYWVYRDSDGKFHATKGMKPSPFMYPSAMVVKKQAPEIQARVLKTYLKKLGV
jgi:HK97 gp10 family phage protein